VEITEVRVKLMDEPGERLKAFCSITFDNAFVVRDLKIIEGASGPFVAMPSRKLTAHCPRCGCKNHLRATYCNQCGLRLQEQAAGRDAEGREKLYADIAHPINTKCREMIQRRVIEAFEEEKRLAREPGYVSSYEDFDTQQKSCKPEPAAPPAEPAERTDGPQPAEEPKRAEQPLGEQPRGPHKAPSQQPHQAPRRANDGFGAGVFD